MTALNLSALADIYVLANTPAYLFKNFRADDSVMAVASDMSAQTLGAELDKLLTGNSLSFSELVGAYALLIALTFKEYREAREVLGLLDLAKLEWGRTLVAIWEFRRPSISSSTFTIQPHLAPPANQSLATLSVITGRSSGGTLIRPQASTSEVTSVSRIITVPK